MTMNVEDISARLEALGNPTRLTIYRTLVRVGDAGLSVGQLQGRLKIAASTLSHHLGKLVVVDLVTQERNSTTLICRANLETMRVLLSILHDECCADQAQAVPSAARSAT